MYIIKAVSKDNIYIKDLDIIVYWNDPDGVTIDNKTFENSKDAKIALDKKQIFITRTDGDFSERPDKHVIETEKELIHIANVYNDMTVYIRNYMETNQSVLAIFNGVEKTWKFITGGSGNSGVGYIHPLTHPATMITQDGTHRFVTDEQITKWNNNSGFDGDYNKLTNKPVIPTKTSELLLDNTYTKNEVDNKIANISVTPSSGSIYRYEPQGATAGDCIVTATGLGVKVVKTNNKMVITKPEDVKILSLQLHFTQNEIGGTNTAEIDYDATRKNSYSPSDFMMPTVQVINDVDGSRAMRQNMSANYNVNPHTVQITGLLANVACWIKLTF